jgi:hypothetical protein
VRRNDFLYIDAFGMPVQGRHQARAMNFQDQSIFSYAHANKNWWGYR